MPNPDSNYYMFTLTPRTAKSGNTYFSGVMGSLSLIAFYAKDGERLNVYVAGNVERKEGGGREGGWKPKPKPEGDAPAPTKAADPDIPF